MGELDGGQVEPLVTRLRRRAHDPTLLANPPVAAAFCLLRALHLIAPLPYWVLILLVAGGGTASWVSTALWEQPTKHWHITAYLATSAGVITVVAYATGYGPILSIGFVFGSGTAVQLFGARATREYLVLTTLWMVLGQVGIGIGVVPTLIAAPLIHGLAALSLLGTLLTISLIGRVTAAREEVESELRQSERRFKALVSNATDIIMVVDGDGRMVYASPSFQRVLGVHPVKGVPNSFGEFIHPEDLDRIRPHVRGLVDDPSHTLTETLRIRDASGEWRHFEATISNRVSDPDVRGIVGNLHDITELREAHERFRSAFDDAPIGMALTTVDGIVLQANRAYGDLLGCDREQLAGHNVLAFTHRGDRARTKEALQAIAYGHSDGYEVEKRYLRADGADVWAAVHVTCVRDSENEARYLIAQVQDVTEQRRMREDLTHAALHDPLTGLPNRVLFFDRLSLALSRAARTGRPVAVAFLDLDRFKLVNDALGHASGDDLLQLVATRLTELLREHDTVARFGGDEFTILLEDLDGVEEAVAVAQRILDELQRPLVLDGSPVFVTASIGLALAEAHQDVTATSMLRDADAAMYVAKDAGRGRVEVFDGKSHTVALESLHVINELHSALANGEFRLHYQPIVQLPDGDVVAAEALVRWQHPQRGIVAPDQFIPLAEECGLIVPIGAWVLRTACAQAARWNAASMGTSGQPVEVQVNISPRQLSSPDFVDTVAAAVADHCLDPALLCLEITESTLMRDEHGSVVALQALRELGVRISIDDFGTGYSSLSYLKRFPIDSLKVDRSFVDGMGEEADDSVIVSAVIALAHSLGIVAVAEGVETEIALEELRRLGCDRVQGYLLGRPQPPEVLDELFTGPLSRRYALLGT
ncbi:MAG TPA: EAL domain-containing protein [Acidimicrobiales bacterium]|nr:EAL domain-containing protein [Acidimicrobiales bacterium]